MSEPVTSDKPTSAEAPPRRRPILMALPLLVFATFAVLFCLRLGSGDPSKIPSALIGRPAPQTTLPPLQGLVAGGAPVPGLDPTVFQGKVSVVNVWASSCVPCHEIDNLRSDFFSRANQIAFILAVFIVHDNDHAPFANVGASVRNGSECHLRF